MNHHWALIAQRRLLSAVDICLLPQPPDSSASSQMCAHQGRGEKAWRVIFYQLWLSFCCFMPDVCFFPRVRYICLYQTAFSWYFFGTHRGRKEKEIKMKKGGKKWKVFHSQRRRSNPLSLLPSLCTCFFKLLSGVTKKMVLLYCDLQSKFPFVNQWH